MPKAPMLTLPQLKTLVSATPAAYRKSADAVAQAMEFYFPKYDFDADARLVLRSTGQSPKRFFVEAKNPEVRRVNLVIFRDMEDFANLTAEISAPLIRALRTKYGTAMEVRFAQVPWAAGDAKVAAWAKRNPGDKFTLRLLAAIEHGFATGTAYNLAQNSALLIDEAKCKKPYDYQVYDNLVFVTMSAKDFLASDKAQRAFATATPVIESLDWRSAIAFDSKAAVEGFLSR
jgi:hypothetical protein